MQMIKEIEDIIGGACKMPMYGLSLQHLHIDINSTTIKSLQKQSDLNTASVWRNFNTDQDFPLYSFYVLINKKEGTYEIYKRVLRSYVI